MNIKLERIGQGNYVESTGAQQHHTRPARRQTPRDNLEVIMPTKMMKLRTGLGALCILLFLVSSKAWAEPYGVNLLAGARNGNAEQGQAYDGGPPGVPVPSWTTNGYFTVVPYGGTAEPGYPTSTDPGPPDRGNQFFSGGHGAVSTALSQPIDLTPNAAEISTGNVVADLSAYLGGSANNFSTAFVYVAFYNGNTSLCDSSCGQVGPVTAADRGYQTRLDYRVKSIPVPATATRLEVGIIIERPADPNNPDPNPYNYGFADSVSLILRAPMVVTTTADSGPGSLRDAIPKGSYITFDPNVFSPSTAPHSIVLLTALPDINGDTTISGFGANNLTVQRSTAAGTPQFGIFTVKPAQPLRSNTPLEPIASFSGLTISNGAASYGGGIYCETNCTILDCTLSGNTASEIGGGVYGEGNLTLNRCTVASNSSQGAGGGISFSHFSETPSLGLTLLNCTVSGNHDGGGSLYVSSNHGIPLEISNCTISGESSALAGSNVSAHLDNNIFFTTGQRPNLTSPAAGAPAIIVSDGFNLSNRDDSTYLNANGDRNNTDPMLGPLQDNGGPMPTHALLPGSLAIDKGNSTRMTDQRGFPRPVDDPNSFNGSGNNSDIGAFEVQLPNSTPTPTPNPTPTPGSLGNISTRLQVGTGNNVLFAGFIIQGNASKTVLIRSAGPSLTQFGVPGALGNPQLELHDANNTIATNDNWQTTQLGGVITSDQVAAIQNSGAAPGDPAEPAIIATLPAGGYTAIVQGVGGTQGVATAEVYDLSPNNGAILANISTRGFIQTGDNVMIGGFIVVGQSARMLIRATGPSLVPFGVNNALANPRLELHDANGALAANDDWQTTQVGGIITGDQSAAIQNSGLAPSNPAESAIIATLAPGNYTAIAQGVNGGTGVGIVEVFALP